MRKPNKQTSKKPTQRLGVFEGWLGLSVGTYVGLILLLIAADVWFVLAAWKADPSKTEILSSDVLLHSVKLTFLTCTVSAILSVLIAIPIGYFLSRYRFWGRALIDAILDIPVILPPLVIGLSLLILFNNFPPKSLDWNVGSLEDLIHSAIGRNVTNTELAVIVAQFTVAAAFAVRTMKATFDQIDPRSEKVAMTLGASRGRAFFDVVLPQSYKGVVASGTLAWARALGEFGPILVFAGTTQGKVDVLSTAVYLEINTGNIEGAVVISLLMIVLAMATILIVRLLTDRKGDIYDSTG